MGRKIKSSQGWPLICMNKCKNGDDIYWDVVDCGSWYVDRRSGGLFGSS